MKFKIIMAFLLGGLFMIVVFQNTEVVSFRFLFWEFSMSRIILLPIFFLTGLSVGFILGKR